MITLTGCNYLVMICLINHIPFTSSCQRHYVRGRVVWVSPNLILMHDHTSMGEKLVTNRMTDVAANNPTKEISMALGEKLVTKQND